MHQLLSYSADNIIIKRTSPWSEYQKALFLPKSSLETGPTCTPTAGRAVAMLWRHVGEWRQTGTSGRELDKSRWRPTMKQEKGVSINKTQSEWTHLMSRECHLDATSFRISTEHIRSRHRWAERVFRLVGWVSGAVAAAESGHITLHPGHWRS